MTFCFRVLAVAFFMSPLALGAVVERIVAVVGERPILLSDVQRRARPFRVRMMASGANPQQMQQAEVQMQKELLQRLIDERLEELAAEKAKVSISREEVDAAIGNVATNARLTVADLLREAATQGLAEADYREELRRQLLEGRLFQLRGRGRPRASEVEARAAFEKWTKQPGNEQPVVRVALLALRAGVEGADGLAARTKAVEDRLAAGAGFCDLVKEFADDVSSHATCGDRGPQPASALLPAITKAVEGLSAGAVSAPFSAGDAVIFAKLIEPLRAPVFEDLREAMTDRAAQESADKQRKAWLLELRAGHFVDVRM